MIGLPREPRFDLLFQPVAIGPVTAPNRFYQVPHCTGMGFALPRTLAAMREVKAEGGWGVVCTEYCSIDPSADDLPSPYASLWDQGDVRNMALTAERVHAHGALAGIELWHGGVRSANLLSRATPMGPESLPADKAPIQSRRMDLADIHEYRRAHKAAARRAREAGFDIIYIYAAHGFLVSQFLDGRLNRRLGEYSGSLENRVRILRELMEETREAIGDKCALAIRIEVDDEAAPGQDPTGERREIFELLRDGPDLFDITITDYYQEMGVSRFHREGSLAPMIRHVKEIVGKPVVSVGRFTSPDTMLAQIREGVIDLIGAARPSIADPFLPRKIEEGRLDDIRECIGCNICYASDIQGVPLRCTQNPTMGEEWRRDWHPERVSRASAAQVVLIVGAGPAGLEAALTLGRAGHRVMLAEASRELGGRVSLESRLPGLQEWARVRDYRVHQLGKLGNVEIFRESPMTAEDVRAIGARWVLVATGSHWRADGTSRTHPTGVPSFHDSRTMTPDQIMRGARPDGPVVVFDDDFYITAAAVAELLALEARDVTYVTTAGTVSAWTRFTAEQAAIQKRLIERGVRIVVGHSVVGLELGGARLSCTYTSRTTVTPCNGFVPVTSREPDDKLWQALASNPTANEAVGIETVLRIGDCKAPGLIATAVHDGHRVARELGVPEADRVWRRERVIVTS